MAHVKAAGDRASQHPQRIGKRLGVKLFGGQKVISGNVIVRQRGAAFHPGYNTRMGRDFTIYSIAEGIVKFRRKLGKQLVEVFAAK